MEPHDDSALYYLKALISADPKNSAIPDLSREIQSQILGRARAKIDENQRADAERLLQLASALGDSPEQAALAARLAAGDGNTSARAAGLVLSKPPRLHYPSSAHAAGTEGWVELLFLVNPDGRVADIRVADSSPKGIFEASAIEAMARARFQPFATGNIAPVSARLRVTFKLNGGKT